MRELVLVLLIVVGMCLFSSIWFVPWELLFRGGILVIVAGFVLGVPTGAVYHLLLYQALAPRGELPKGWIWRPIRLNEKLKAEERGPIVAWCYAGGLGFVLIVLGILLLGGGVTLALIKGV